MKKKIKEEKQVKPKSKAATKKEILKIRVEINEIEPKITIQRGDHYKAGYLRK